MKKLLVPLMAILMTACNSGGSSTPSGTTVSSNFTNAVSQFAPQANQQFQALESAPESAVISVDDNHKYQTITGFGAALSDSSAYLLNLMPLNQRTQLLNQLFNPQTGLGISYLRLTISASDFSLTNYTYDNMPAGMTDPYLLNFSIAHDESYIIPILQQILAINPNLKIIMSPWSAPGWMKTNDSILGDLGGDSESAAPNLRGYLKSDYYQSYANYFTNIVRAYQVNGITINAMTIQNEPLYSPTGYPGLYMDSHTQSDFLESYLVPTFINNNITTQVYVYDHNWDREDYPDYVLGQLQSQAESLVAGTAFHCYGGDVTAQTTLHDKYPNKQIMVTECSGGTWTGDFTQSLISDMQGIYIGNLNNWGTGTLKWNLVLDQNNGPVNPTLGGCLTCYGIVNVDTSNNYQVRYNEDYYATGIMSKNLLPGAVRIKVSSNSDNLIATGVINPNGSHAIVILNQSTTISQPFALKWNDQYITATIPAGTVAVYTW